MQWDQKSKVVCFVWLSGPVGAEVPAPCSSAFRTRMLKSMEEEQSELACSVSRIDPYWITSGRPGILKALFLMRPPWPIHRCLLFLWEMPALLQIGEERREEERLFSVSSWASPHLCSQASVRAKSLQSCLLTAQWTIACQAPLSMGFSRQGYCSGLPCPPPGDLPDPGMEPFCSHNWVQLTNNVFPED